MSMDYTLDLRMNLEKIDHMNGSDECIEWLRENARILNEEVDEIFYSTEELDKLIPDFIDKKANRCSYPFGAADDGIFEFTEYDDFYRLRIYWTHENRDTAFEYFVKYLSERMKKSKFNMAILSCSYDYDEHLNNLI